MRRFAFVQDPEYYPAMHRLLNPTNEKLTDGTLHGIELRSGKGVRYQGRPKAENFLEEATIREHSRLCVAIDRGDEGAAGAVAELEGKWPQLVSYRERMGVAL
jgi:hypothetical protein